MGRSTDKPLEQIALFSVLALLAACSTDRAAIPGGSAVATTTTTTTASEAVPASSPPTAAPAQFTTCGWHTAARPATYEHVVWIWFENHTDRQVIGSRAAPYTNSLAAECGRASNYAAVGAPSLPNYLAATSGDTHGIHDDSPPTAHQLESDNIFRQVRTSGRIEHSYEESMPGPCATESSARYAVKHNPAAYYVGDDRAACVLDDGPLGSTEQGPLATALRLDTLPAFSMITPDLCNDTHDCDIATGDAWLAAWLPRILDSAAYRRGSTAIFIVWDEPTPMPFITVAPSVPVATVSDTAVDHYSLLRTTQELLGLTPLLGNAARATSLRDLFNL